MAKKSKRRAVEQRSPSEQPDQAVDDMDDVEDAAAARQRARDRAGDEALPRKAGRTNSGKGR